MKWLFVNETKIPLPRKFLQSWGNTIEPLLQRQRVRGALGLRERELTLVWLNPRAAQALNRQHRGRDYATDVLSFSPVLDPDEKSPSLGELVMCPQVLRRQAQEHQLAFRAELGYMVLHGVLHLLGYDHERSPAESAKMLGIQDRIFAVAAHKMGLD